jgi:ATP-dependent RNA helicase RhlE
MTFHNLWLIAPILRTLDEAGYTIPTPIQERSIPIILSGKDIFGCAQTGTGKTAAFSLPILQILSTPPQKEGNVWLGQPKDFRKIKKIRALIVTPTRELAIQIGENLDVYGKYTGITNTVIFGGVSQFAQTKALERGVDILVATPGRLLDLIQQRFISLQHITHFVLDEADRMLDMGFIHDVKKLLKLIPENRQSLFFSATVAPEIMQLAQTILKNPARVEVTPVSSTVEVIEQGVYFVDKENKNLLLLHCLQDSSITSALVFSRTKHGADKIAKFLESHGISAQAIHGNKSQNNRQRALAGFKDGEIRVLVATDIAARGIDIDNLQYVFNTDVPDVSETYVHRIGRTGRAGANGCAYTFCDALDKVNLRAVEKLINKKIPVIEGHPFPLMDHSPVIEPKGQRGRAFAKQDPHREKREANARAANAKKKQESEGGSGASFSPRNREKPRGSKFR